MQRRRHLLRPVEVRERDLKLIDFDYWPGNRFEVIEGYYFHNGRYGNWADVVFLINGIPVLVIECKNATKDEAIALGVDQIRRYHSETPELMVPPQLFTAAEAIGFVFVYGVTWNAGVPQPVQLETRGVGATRSQDQELLRPQEGGNPNGIPQTATAQSTGFAPSGPVTWSVSTRSSQSRP